MMNILVTKNDGNYTAKINDEAGVTRFALGTTKEIAVINLLHTLLHDENDWDAGQIAVINLSHTLLHDGNNWCAGEIAVINLLYTLLHNENNWYAGELRITPEPNMIKLGGGRIDIIESTYVGDRNIELHGNIELDHEIESPNIVLCPKCRIVPAVAESCPMDEELRNITTMCACCDDCRRECAQEI